LALAKKIRQEWKLTLEMIAHALLDLDLIREQEARLIYQENRLSKVHPLIIISKYEFKDQKKGLPLTLDRLTELFAQISNVEYTRIDPTKINYESIIDIIPRAYAMRLNILPLEVKPDLIIFATSDPFELSWINEIESITKRKVAIKLASPLQIKTILEEIFIVQGAMRESIKARSKEQNRLIKAGRIEELDQIIEKNKSGKWDFGDNSVVLIVDWLIGFAFSERASDIHIEPKKGMGHIRFRIDGNLRVVYKMDPELMLNVVSRFKILAGMKLDEKRKPLDGRIKRFMGEHKIEMRVSSIPCFYGEKVVIRIFDFEVAKKDLAFVGFNESDYKTWDKLINSSQGIILVTGPTGSGKTTTLYSSLNSIATNEVNVCTVEDPIEMTVDAFNQVQVNPDIGLTFASCVRAFLRQDPDIVMVGEIRDFETAEIAVQASLTGHLVFSTLHTNGALASIVRLIDLGLPTYLINSSIIGILAQRLVRRLCPSCKEKVPTSKYHWNLLTLGEQVKMPEHVYEARGCHDCKDVGYVGRFCLYELVEFTPEIKSLITQKSDVIELERKSKGLFTSFKVNAASRVVSGETSIDEVLKVIF
jgi:general secretion pathway protein E